MLTAADYMRQAELNAELLEQLPKHRFDWGITACFYTALHWLNAVTRTMGKPEARNHTQTFENIREARLPPRVRMAYQALFGFSLQARYECIAVKALEATYQESVKLLEKVQTYARGILKVQPG